MQKHLTPEQIIVKYSETIQKWRVLSIYDFFNITYLVITFYSLICNNGWVEQLVLKVSVSNTPTGPQRITVLAKVQSQSRQNLD